MEKITHKDEFEKIRQEILDQRIEYLQKGEKRSKDIATIATSVAGVSLLTIVANILTEDPMIAAQTAGTCVAMATYSVGNLKLKNYYKKLIETTNTKKQNPPEQYETAAILEKLENYKSRLEYYKINYPTHVVAGLGFLESFIVTLINTINTVNTNTTISLIPLVFTSSLTGLVALGHVKLASDSKSQISYYQGLVQDTNTEIEIKEKSMKLK